MTPQYSPFEIRLSASTQPMVKTVKAALGYAGIVLSSESNDA